MESEPTAPAKANKPAMEQTSLVVEAAIGNAVPPVQNPQTPQQSNPQVTTEQNLQTQPVQQPQSNSVDSSQKEASLKPVDPEEQEPQVKEEDKRSVFVENVDYGATKEDLENIFCDCGKIVRVTILRDKFTNSPRGLAYVQFAEVESVQHAIVLTGAELRGRFIRVSPKRTNIKGMAKPKQKKFGANDNANALIQGLLGMMKKPGRFSSNTAPKPRS